MAHPRVYRYSRILGILQNESTVMIVVPKSDAYQGNGERPRALPTLGVAVEDHLLDAMVEGRLAPGSPLRETSLAGSLEISSTPIRDALARLAHTGLVEIISNKSKRVSSLCTKMTLDMLEVRHILLSEAWARVWERLNPEHIGQLQFQVEGLGAALSQGNLRQAIRSYLRFDELIVLAAGSHELSRMFESRRSYVERHLYLECSSWINKSVLDYYRALILSIEQKDSVKSFSTSTAVHRSLMSYLSQAPLEPG
jgi:DNA-binding GntR family transcriptional regulator